MANPVLEQRFLGRIVPGMDVCDVGGDKIGSVAQIHRYTELPDPESTAEMPEEYIEVKSGLFGLGKHYFIPLSLVQEVLTDSLYVDKAKEDLDSLGFDRKPDHLPETH